MIGINKVCAIFIVLFLFIPLSSKGQSVTMNEGGIEMQISPVDTSLSAFFCEAVQLPEFPGGINSLVSFAKNRIKYPKTAINDNVQGSVLLQFIINKEGKVTDKKIIKSVRNDIDSVCLNMLDQMPDWKPAKLGRKPIGVYERWKIIFILTE